MTVFVKPALPWFHPATIVATWFGSGLVAKAPGTWGSLAALPFAWALAWIGGPWLLAAAIVPIFLIGLWASHVYAKALGRADPGSVVIDEVAGQWLALLPVATAGAYYPLAFIAFRFFDILKLWPVGWLDKHVKGAFGIMADDIMAGIYGGAVTFAALYGIESLTQ